MKYLPLFYLLFLTVNAMAQEEPIERIELQIREKKFQNADKILREEIQKYSQKKLPDSLVNYIFITGKLGTLSQNEAYGTAQITQLVNRIHSMNPGPEVLKQAHINAGEFFGYIGKNNSGFEQNLKALDYALKVNSTPSELALVHNNLSTFAQRRGDFASVETHSRKAISLLKSTSNPDYKTLYMAQNGMGTVMYYSSRLDSALYFYKEAIQTLQKLPREPLNQFYRVAIIQNNMAGIYSQQGNSQMAIESMEQVIRNLEKFNAAPGEFQKKSSGISFQFEAVDNLAGIYKELGNFQKAKSLLEYSYQRKKAVLTTDDPGIFNSQILLGQMYYAMRDHDKATSYLMQGITNYERMDPGQFMWLADGYQTLALIADAKNDFQKATIYYNTADSLYEKSLQGNYDDIYLDFLRNKSKFFAEHGNLAEAKRISKKSFQYIIEAQGKNSLGANRETLNLSNIEYLGGNYQSAIQYSKEGLRYINERIAQAANIADSIKLETLIPQAILYQCKAEYQSHKPKADTSFIQNLLGKLDQAMGILQRRRAFVNDPENNRILLADNSELFEFVKELNLALYKLTNNQSYADTIMGLNESVIYSQIRNRLAKDDSLQFFNIPANILKEEKRLRNEVEKSLVSSSDHKKALSNYLMASEHLKTFIETLRHTYPDYYKLKYASVISSLGDVRKIVPENRTLLRYFFSGNHLYALVADKNFKKIIPLDASGIESLITTASDPASGNASVFDALHTLYLKLWKPLEADIKYNKVTIVPDGILFNINLEILTQTRITSLQEIKTKSLIAKYTLSYEYSLFLLEQSAKPGKKNQSFAGFAPGFSDELKNKYSAQVKDSFLMDRDYLYLLPQPFTISLVKKISGLFDGSAYLNEDCTKEEFMKSAGNHTILHIATHAVSDNIHPEYSRLIFSKNTNNYSAQNFLYLNDIYTCNLQSDLTVLSACETGKPGYKDGEGMISLANAFNYSGSKSLVMGLWKIDEHASSILLEKFYKYIRQGLSKDEALRQAKLDYLSEANGRMLLPAYWAGLVVMGNTEPIAIQESNTYWQWLILIITAVVAIAMIRKQRKNNTAN